MRLSHAVRPGLLDCSFPRAHRENGFAGTNFDSAFDYERGLAAPSGNATDASRADLAQKKEFRHGR